MNKNLKHEKEQHNSEPPKMCGHITKKGTPCKNKAEPGHIYCKIHLHDEPLEVKEENAEVSDMNFLMNSIYNYHENRDFLQEEENNSEITDFEENFEENKEFNMEEELGEIEVTTEDLLEELLSKEELTELKEELEIEEVAETFEVPTEEKLEELPSIEEEQLEQPIEEIALEELLKPKEEFEIEEVAETFEVPTEEKLEEQPSIEEEPLEQPTEEIALEELLKPKEEFEIEESAETFEVPTEEKLEEQPSIEEEPLEQPIEEIALEELTELKEELEIKESAETFEVPTEEKLEELPNIEEEQLEQPTEEIALEELTELKEELEIKEVAETFEVPTEEKLEEIPSIEEEKLEQPIEEIALEELIESKEEFEIEEVAETFEVPIEEKLEEIPSIEEEQLEQPIEEIALEELLKPKEEFEIEESAETFEVPTEEKLEELPSIEEEQLEQPSEEILEGLSSFEESEMRNDSLESINEEFSKISLLDENSKISEEIDIIKEENNEDTVNLKEETVFQEAAERIKDLDNELGIDFDKILKEIDSENQENNSPENNEVERKSAEMSEGEKEELLKDIEDDDIPILLNELDEEDDKEENDELGDLNQLLESIDENSDLTQVIGANNSERGKNLFDDEILEELDLPTKNKKESVKKEKKKVKKEPSKIWTGMKYFVVKYKYKIFIFVVGIALISAILVMKNPLQIVKEPKLKQEVVSKLKDVEIEKAEKKENVGEVHNKEEKKAEENIEKVHQEETVKHEEKIVEEDKSVKHEMKESTEVKGEKSTENSSEKTQDLIDRFESEVAKLKGNPTGKEREEINKNIEDIVKEIKKSEAVENSGRAEKIRNEIEKITVTANPDIVKTNGINAAIVLKVESSFNFAKTVEREKLNRDIYKVIESGFDKFSELNSISINIIKSGGRGKILEVTARRYEFEKIDGIVKDYSSILSNFRVVER